MNILTFDIEDWFIINDSDWIHHSRWSALPSHIDKNVRTILALLDKHGVKATFFILGWVAEHHPELVREIHKHGHETGFHSYYHRRPQRQSEHEFEEELVRGLTLLEDITCAPVTKYRAPNLSLTSETQWVYPILARNGITVSSSVISLKKLHLTNIHNNPVRVRTIEGDILEFPLNRLDLKVLKLIYSGSGFFRLFPFWALNRLFSKGQYNLLYFHPRDFDRNVPCPDSLGCFRNWKQSVNTSSTLPKLDKLMNQTIFTTLTEAAETYKHLQLPEVNLIPPYPFRKTGS